MLALCGILMAVAMLWSFAGVAAVARVIGPRRFRAHVCTTPVSILKPLCGVDDGLEKNLISFFELDHPGIELIFGVSSSDDPVLPIVRRLRERYAHVRSKIVVVQTARALNPKVNSLLGMWHVAAHDTLLISDSNVRVPADYVTSMLDALRGERVGLVTSLFAGTSERSLGSLLSNAQLNGPIAIGVALPTLLGHPAVVGKSLMFRRSVLERLGGLERLRNVLAEDYVMGMMFHRAGYRVRLSSVTVRNVSRTATVRAFVSRQMRWSMMRMRLAPLAYVLEPLSSPWTTAVVGIALGGSAPLTVAWAMALTLGRDGLIWTLLRGPKGLAHALLWVPVRDLLMLVVWLATPLRRYVSWRGKRYRLGWGTLLHPDDAFNPA
jgi:ceramide glucosyltransferase